MSNNILTGDYATFLSDLKSRILQSRGNAARAVNRELVSLYWDIGGAIVQKQQSANWGDSVVEQLAADLRTEFPDMRGFSTRNLWDMQRLYTVYTDLGVWCEPVRKTPAFSGAAEILRQPVAEFANQRADGIPEHPVPEIEFLRQLVAEIPWGHNLAILHKVAAPSARLYYLQATAQFAWSRKVLLTQIKAGAYERAITENKTHNFGLTLPEHFAEQADEMMKSRYNLEFLGIARAVRERDLESRLIEQLQKFLLELGYGFCFIGRQYRLVLGQKEYFIDLLFYHRFLKALVAFDLKIGSFEPEHAGKMDFYLNLLNDTQRGPDDQPSIGIILCAEKDDIEVEYSLKSKSNPIGVAEYELQSRLPAELEGKLPTSAQLTKAIRRALPDPDETH